jgi:hypothetical protein
MILEKVFDLVGVEWKQETEDPTHYINKLEIKFEKTEPLDQSLNIFIQCLADSHEQMLIFIQKYPNSKKLIMMEENPLNSKDLTFGIP